MEMFIFFNGCILIYMNIHIRYFYRLEHVQSGAGSSYIRQKMGKCYSTQKEHRLA